MTSSQLSVSFFIQMFFILLSCHGIGRLAKKYLGQPQVVGEMISGVLQLYRQRVLEAVTRVEDSLSTLRTLTDEAQAQARTLAAARRAMDLADVRYRNGAASILDLIDAQRSAYGAQRAETRVAGARLMATVALIHAIGGG